MASLEALSGMSNPARLIGLVAAVAMLLFSSYMYLTVGDWVALVFIAGSLGYIVLFLSTAKDNNS